MQKIKTGLATAVVLATGLSGAPAHSQQVELKDFISGTKAPLSLQMKDLTTEYRRLVVTGQSDMGTYMQMIGASVGVETNVYYTKGETVEMGGETYLLAYRPQMPIDPRVFNGGHGEQPVVTPPGRNTKLALSLLNLRTSGSLNDVRPFDAKKDIATTKETNAASQRNLTQLGQGVTNFLQNRGGKFPTMGKKVTEELRRSYYPFVHDARTYTHPGTEEDYIPNSLLSGKRADDIRNSNLVWLFVEANAADDGTRRVLFADGHVESMDAARWGRVQKIVILSDETKKPTAGKVVTAPGSNIGIVTNEAEF